MAKTAEQYLEQHAQWVHILEPLRSLCLEAGLEETVKWGMPVYTANGRNVAGLGAFKAHAGIWFFDGALLDDPAGILINAQEGKTRGMRQWRFGAEDSVDSNLVRSYLTEAIGNARAGKTIKPKRHKSLPRPELLTAALDRDPALREAFDGLSPGKRREFIEFIAEAKWDATRKRRLEKIIPMIRRGEGLNDRYR